MTKLPTVGKSNTTKSPNGKPSKRIKVKDISSSDGTADRHSPSNILHIADNWMSGFIYHPEAEAPAIGARSALSNCDDSGVRQLWQSIDSTLVQWCVEKGAPVSLTNPWVYGGPGIYDYIDFVELLYAFKTNAGPRIENLFETIPYPKIIAITILHEIAQGDACGITAPLEMAENNDYVNRHLVAALKGRRILEISERDARISEQDSFIEWATPKLKQQDELMASGRKKGTEAIKKKAKERKLGLRQAAENYFQKNPTKKTYDDCADALLDEKQYAGLTLFLTVNSKTNKRITKTTLLGMIAGTRDIALSRLQLSASAQPRRNI